MWQKYPSSGTAHLDSDRVPKTGRQPKGCRPPLREYGLNTFLRSKDRLHNSCLKAGSAPRFQVGHQERSAAVRLPVGTAPSVPFCLLKYAQNYFMFGSAPKHGVGLRNRSASRNAADRISPHSLIDKSKIALHSDPRPNVEWVPESGQQPTGCWPEHSSSRGAGEPTTIALHSDPRPDAGWVSEIGRFASVQPAESSRPAAIENVQLLEVGIRAPASSGSPSRVGSPVVVGQTTPQQESFLEKPAIALFLDPHPKTRWVPEYDRFAPRGAGRFTRKKCFSCLNSGSAPRI